MYHYLLYAAISLTLCADAWGSCRRQALGFEVGATNESIKKFFKGIEESDLNSICEAYDEGVVPSLARVEVQNSGVSVLMTALDYAGSFASSEEVIDWLIENGGDINAQDNSIGATPLMFALSAWDGKPNPELRAVKRLFNAPGIDYSRVDKRGRTIMDYSLKFCPTACLHFVLGSLRAMPEADASDNPLQQKRLLNALLDKASDIEENISAIEVALYEGADLHAQFPGGMTALAHAISFGRCRRIFDLLYKRGVDFTEEVMGVTPLMLALSPIIKFCDPNCSWAMWMLEKEDLLDVNQADSVGGRTALHNAVSIQHQQAIGWLLEKGADPLHADKGGVTPWSTAVIQNPPNFETIRLLAAAIKQKGQSTNGLINTLQPVGTVFDWVLLQPTINTDLLKVLGEYTSLDEQEPVRGTTLLMRYLAQKPPHYYAAWVLLEAGANPNIVGNGGWPAITYFLLAQEFNAEYADYALGKGVNLAIRNATGQTLLMQALAGGKYAAADWLLSKCPELLDATDNMEWTAVMHALMHSTMADEIRYLHSKGASLNGVQGLHSPVNTAISLGRTCAAMLLADLGADLTQTGIDGMTALGLALQKGLALVVKKLLEKGAPADALSACYHPLLHITTAPIGVDAKIKLYKILAPNCNFVAMDRDQLKGWELWLKENASAEQKVALTKWEAPTLPSETQKLLLALRAPADVAS